MKRKAAPLPAPPRTLLTVRQFSQRHPAFTEASLRYLIFLAGPRYCRIRGKRSVIPGNGLDFALVRLGRRVLIDEVRFFEWADRQQMKGRRVR